jgi:RNA polymerase sigma-70 factor (ECF subfamily)
MRVARRDLTTLFSAGTLGGLTDAELLERFAACREEAAFEILVQRHGAMVWGVCRRVLGDHHDAEDAFQATFLVLARKGHTIAHRELVGNWLYGVACQTAMKARSMRAKRRKREGPVPDVIVKEPEALPEDVRNDLTEWLDQELSRLPQKYRSPLVLCALEGKTHREAAKQLGWPIGTVSGRLSRAKAMLASRLSRRGVPLSGVALAVFLAREASAGVPASLTRDTARAARLFAAGQAAATGAISAKVATLTGGVLKAMLIDTFRTSAAGLLVVAVLGVTAAGLNHRTHAAGRSDAAQPEQDRGETSKNDAARSDEQRLQGTWSLVKAEANGVEMPTFFEPKEGSVVTIAGATWTSNFFMDGSRFRVRLDPTSDPKAIDLHTLEDADKTLLGIYHLDDDDLKFCICIKGKQERPSAFENYWRAGSITALLVLRRQWADASVPGAVSRRAQPVERDDWKRKLAGLNEADWRTAFAIGQELAALPADEGFTILRLNWGKITKFEARQQILKAWRFALHPRLVDVLNLGMRDPSPNVQGWATGYLNDVAFRDFSEDFQAYDEWYRASHDKPLVEVVTRSARRFAAEAARSGGADAEKRALWLVRHENVLRALPEVRRALLDAGLLPTLGRWAWGATNQSPRAEIERVAHAVSTIGRLNPGEAELRRVVVPLLARENPLEVRAAAIGALEGRQNAWAIDLLLDVLKESLKEEDGSFKTIVGAVAGTLASFDDPRVIPTMIAVIEADNTYDTVYGVGYFGLGRLTGVEYDESHDGAWWQRWWEKNKERYPEFARALEIPALPKRR